MKTDHELDDVDPKVLVHHRAQSHRGTREPSEKRFVGRVDDELDVLLDTEAGVTMMSVRVRAGGAGKDWMDNN